MSRLQRSVHAAPRRWRYNNIVGRLTAAPEDNRILSPLLRRVCCWPCRVFLPAGVLAAETLYAQPARYNNNNNIIIWF